jgi:hypothetical protein
MHWGEGRDDAPSSLVDEPHAAQIFDAEANKVANEGTL